MSNFSITLTDALKSFVDEQVNQRGYNTNSEYVRELIRKEQERQQLTALLLDGAASTPGVAVTTRYFDTLRKKIRGRSRR